MMTDEEYQIISAASKVVQSRFVMRDSDISRLLIEFQTFLHVETSQGIIDNGGLRFFFESDFEGQPPYSTIIDAYRRIGATGAGECLATAVELFPFPDPHLYDERRREVIERLWDQRDKKLLALDDYLCGNTEVWTKLCEYVLTHRDQFRVGR